MKTKKKALLVVLAAVLLLSVSVLGTLAWLYDTETKGYDVFTVGDIDITFTIDESWIADADAVEWVPNHQYSMNPTITVKGGSEECYIRMFITVTDADDLLAAAAPVDKVGNIFLIGHYADLIDNQWFVEEGTNNWNDEDWYNYTAGNFYDAANGGTITYEFRLRNTVAESGTDTVVNGAFDTFTLPFYFNNEEVEALDEMTVSFEVQAIQAVERGADKFTEAEAWAAYDAQVALDPANAYFPNPYVNGGSNASGWSDEQ